jgi:hypothetical protein
VIASDATSWAAHTWSARHRFEIVLVGSHPVASTNGQHLVGRTYHDETVNRCGKTTFDDVDAGASRRSRGYCLGRRDRKGERDWKKNQRDSERRTEGETKNHTNSCSAKSKLGSKRKDREMEKYERRDARQRREARPSAEEVRMVAL